MTLQKANSIKSNDDEKVVFNFNDIAAEAQALVTAARQEADEMIAEAHQKVDAIRQETQEQGHQEGFEQGMKEGEVKGYDQALVKGREEFTQMNQEAMASLKNIINEFDRVKHEIICRAEQDTVLLAVAIAKKVIKKAAMLSEDITAENIKVALSFVSKPTDLVVKVNARDVDHLKTLTDEKTDVFGRFHTLRFEPDESIEPGGCIVATESGQVDGQLDVQIERIVQEIVITQ